MAKWKPDDSKQEGFDLFVDRLAMKLEKGLELESEVINEVTALSDADKQLVATQLLSRMGGELSDRVLKALGG